MNLEKINMIKNIFLNLCSGSKILLIEICYADGNAGKWASLYIEIEYLAYKSFLKNWKKKTEGGQFV